MRKEAVESVEKLWEEVRELSLGTTTQIDRLQSPPTPLQFLRDYVSPNKPCIISNATRHWPALKSWPDSNYLSQTLSQSTVSLHLTPNGLADALTPSPPLSPSPLCFASAHVEHMPFPQALNQITSSESPSQIVAYAQEQNDCFRTEYSALADDVEGDLPWATEALGCAPEAVNLWIGNHLSQTSFHKDHYENLYAVVTGEKHFLLLPPTDCHRLYVRPYPAAQYSFNKDTGEFMLELEKPVRYVPWCSVNPYPPPETKAQEMLRFPLYFNGPKPFECTVKAGEILYLPSMWFHHVRQTPDSNGRTISINYCEKPWRCTSSFTFYLFICLVFGCVDCLKEEFLAGYDMQFDIKYAYFNFLQSIHFQSYSDPPSSIKHQDDDSQSDKVGVK